MDFFVYSHNSLHWSSGKYWSLQIYQILTSCIILHTSNKSHLLVSSWTSSEESRIRKLLVTVAKRNFPKHCLMKAHISIIDNKYYRLRPLKEKISFIFKKKKKSLPNMSLSSIIKQIKNGFLEKAAGSAHKQRHKCFSWRQPLYFGVQKCCRYSDFITQNPGKALFKSQELIKLVYFKISPRTLWVKNPMDASTVGCQRPDSCQDTSGEPTTAFVPGVLRSKQWQRQTKS